MSTGSINNLSNSYLQSVLSTALQGTGLTTKAANSPGRINASQPDTSQLSPFARVISALQQLQQSDPSKYQQVTQQIAANLQSAAQTAQSGGNTALANQLNHLATDFTNASKSGQLPNIQDLARAIGGHHHHHAHSASGDSDGSSAATSSASSTNDPTGASQLPAVFQTSEAQNSSLNPTAIILDTLTQAGIGNS